MMHNMLQPDDIRYLVVHCSDTPDTDPIDARAIHAMHLGFGWDGAGYHAIITRDGHCHAGRPEYWQGAHVRTRNHDSLGVCLIGRQDFTPAQFIALTRLLTDWSNRYPDAQIVGHRDIQQTDKTCPNFDAGKWWAKHNPLAQEQAVILTPHSSLYRTAPQSTKPAPETEALLGETVQILDKHTRFGFAHVKLNIDGYEGWISAQDLGCISSDNIGKPQKICAASCLVTSLPDVKSPPLCSLSMGAVVYCLEQEQDFTKILLPGPAYSQIFGYIATPALKLAEDWPEQAKRLLGAPYKWGGRSAAGLDCSALLQLAIGAFGYAIPRDSGPQLHFMQSCMKPKNTAYKEYQRGDILFWDGHVAACLDTHHLLHANAFHNAVAIEPITDAIGRIQQVSSSPIAHIDNAALGELLKKTPRL